MFVITADQKGSRTDVDRAGTGRDDLASRFEGRLVLPVDRTSRRRAAGARRRRGHRRRHGARPHPRRALERRARDRNRAHPAPPGDAGGTGPAVFAARDAVGAAKRSATRFALAVDPPAPPRPDGPGSDLPGSGLPGPDEVEALITLLLLARDRRTAQGWDVVDRMADGSTQREVAAALGVTPQAVSTRLRTSAWRAERAAIPGLVALLAHLDAQATRGAGAVASAPRSTRAGTRS